MARRSQRVQKIHETKSVTPSSNLATESEATPDKTDSDVEARSTKRSKTSRAANSSRAPRRRGKLQGMLDMPLDVIMEICSLLHPKDLLNLTRTSKGLREFFMSRNTLSLWKAARLNLPTLPPCPADLTEPAYANLMFDPHCHSCGNNNCHHVYWRYRVRLCKKCRQRLTAIASDHYPLVKLIAPRRLDDVVPPFEDNTKREHLDNRTYYESELKRLALGVKQTPPAELDSYLNAQEKLASLRKEASCSFVEPVQTTGEQELNDWFTQKRSSRTEELDKLRRARRFDIVAKLKEDGWKAEITYLTKPSSSAECTKFIKLPEVRKTQALTPKIWNNIREPIINFMHSVRINRLSADHTERVTQRLQTTSELLKEILPLHQRKSLSSREVVVKIPKVWQMLDTDAEEFDNEELRRVLQTLIPEYLEKRTQETRIFFETILREEFGIEASSDPWKLALTAFFNCGCRQSMSFEHVLHHGCGYATTPCLSRPEGMSIECYNSIQTVYRYDWIWNVDAFSSTFHSMKRVIEVCGLDIKKATVDDLERPEIRLSSPDPGRCNYTRIMTWRTAVHDQYQDIALATEAQISAAKAAEPVAEKLLQKELKYQCTRCTEVYDVKKSDLMTHLKKSHAVEEPTEDDWVLECTKLPAQTPIYLVPNMKPKKDWYYWEAELFESGIAVPFLCE
ncbi:hypothetical protein BC835DRAFT_1531354 [Cytidiella melzeri]|nr:hypothetical protein BC835DRAFT_1531354 [Cytidiella melzeri]